MYVGMYVCRGPSGSQCFASAIGNIKQQLRVEMDQSSARVATPEPWLGVRASSAGQPMKRLKHRPAPLCSASYATSPHPGGKSMKQSSKYEVTSFPGEVASLRRLPRARSWANKHGHQVRLIARYFAHHCLPWGCRMSGFKPANLVARETTNGLNCSWPQHHTPYELPRLEHREEVSMLEAFRILLKPRG